MMNSPRIPELQCPNPSCSHRKANRYINLPSVPFEKLQYVQLDANGGEVASVIVYRCRYCGREFTLEG